MHIKSDAFLFISNKICQSYILIKLNFNKSVQKLCLINFIYLYNSIFIARIFLKNINIFIIIKNIHNKKIF